MVCLVFFPLSLSLSLFISADLPAASRVAFQLNFPLSGLSIDKVKNLVDPPRL